MGQVGLPGGDQMAHVQGFAERKMGDMGLFAQGVDHQRIDAFEFVELFGRNVVEIGQVGNTSDPRTALQAAGTGVPHRRYSPIVWRRISGTPGYLCSTNA